MFSEDRPILRDASQVLFLLHAKNQRPKLNDAITKISMNFSRSRRRIGTVISPVTLHRSPLATVQKVAFRFKGMPIIRKLSHPDFPKIVREAPESKRPKNRFAKIVIER